MVQVLDVARRQPDIQIAYVSTWGMSTRHLALAGHARQRAALPHSPCFIRPEPMLRDHSKGFRGCVAVVPRSAPTPPLLHPGSARSFCRMTCNP